MQGILPVTGMYHLGIVVPDAEKSMKNFSEILGIQRWEVRDLSDDKFGKPLVHGKHVKQHFISAVGVGGAFCVELCQPLAGDRTVYAEFLDESGPGLHHIFPSLINQQEFELLLPKLEERGIKFAQSAEITDAIDYWYLDTQDQLGTLIELIVLKEPNAVGKDPHWVVEFGKDVTATDGRLPIDKLYHYAVTSRNPAEQIKHGYEDIFGVTDWFDFENKPNETIARSRYEGVPADYRFKSWSGRKGALGVEMVEPQGGGSIFEEKLKRGGAGMHHLMTTITNAEQWEKSSKWLAARGMPIAQDAWTPDGSTYIAFIDTREKLDGMYLEILVRQDDREPMQGHVADILIGR